MRSLVPAKIRAESGFGRDENDEGVKKRYKSDGIDSDEKDGR